MKLRKRTAAACLAVFMAFGTPSTIAMAEPIEIFQENSGSSNLQNGILTITDDTQTVDYYESEGWKWDTQENRLTLKDVPNTQINGIKFDLTLDQYDKYVEVFVESGNMVLCGIENQDTIVSNVDLILGTGKDSVLTIMASEGQQALCNRPNLAPEILLSEQEMTMLQHSQ